MSEGVCNAIYRACEELREQWADVMLDALIQNGHVSFTKDEHARLKGDLMQLLIGRMKI